MTQDEIIEMARQAGFVIFPEDCAETLQEFFAFAKLIAAKEREACEALHEHEDVLAPVGNSAWGEAYQEGWGEGTAAYLQAIRARGES